MDLEAPETENPLWSTQSSNTRNGADTWRCKECHGWDYMGADGAYGSGSHATGFSGVLGSASLSSAELASWLSGGQNPDHDFSAVLPGYAQDALVAFIQNEMVDITPYVNTGPAPPVTAWMGKLSISALQTIRRTSEPWPPIIPGSSSTRHPSASPPIRCPEAGPWGGPWRKSPTSWPMPKLCPQNRTHFERGQDPPLFPLFFQMEGWAGSIPRKGIWPQ